MKIIAKLKKTEKVRFVSHLDVQRMLQRTVRRAGLPISFSQGFNPHPLISFATALAVGQTGDSEWIEFRFDQDIDIDFFLEAINKNLPDGFKITHAFIAKPNMPSISTLMTSAVYYAKTTDAINPESLELAVNSLLNGEITVKKHKKQNGKKVKDAEVDIRPLLIEMKIINCDFTGATVYIKGVLTSSSGLNADLLMKALNEKLNQDIFWHIHRESIELKEF